MKLGDYITKTQVADSTDAMGAGYEREHARLRDLLYGEIPSERIAQLLARGREVARRELAATIDQSWAWVPSKRCSRTTRSPR